MPPEPSRPPPSHTVKAAPPPPPRAAPPARRPPNPPHEPLRRLRLAVRMTKHPRHRVRLSRGAGAAAKHTSVAVAAALLGEVVLKQHALTQEEVDLELKEYVLQTAMQLIIISLLL